MNQVYELAIKQFNVHSLLDLKIKWFSIFQWLAYFSWVGRSYEVFAEYMKKKGYPLLWKI